MNNPHELPSYRNVPEAKAVIDNTIKRCKDKSYNAWFEFTKEERKALSKTREYWWMKYKGIGLKTTIAGHLTATGECKSHNKDKRCHQFDKLYVEHYGEAIYPCCFACWTKVGEDDFLSPDDPMHPRG